jgi:hypothetical protein
VTEVPGLNGWVPFRGGKNALANLPDAFRGIAGQGESKTTLATVAGNVSTARLQSPIFFLSRGPGGR